MNKHWKGILIVFILAICNPLSAQPAWFFVEESQVAAYYKDFKRAIDQMETAITLDSTALHRTHWAGLARWYKYTKDTLRSFEAMKVAVDQGLVMMNPRICSIMFQDMGFVELEGGEAYRKKFTRQSQAYTGALDSVLLNKIFSLSKPIKEISSELFTLRKDHKIVSGPQFDSLMRRRITLQNSALTELKKILDTHGWPGYSMVGVAASREVKTIAIHGDLNLLEYCMPLFLKEVKAFNANKRDYAYMEDRLHHLRGIPVKYGIYYTPDPENKTSKMDPIEDWEKVNRRRILAVMEIIWWRDGYSTF